MATKNKKVSILLATYNPNLRWFDSLLNSLNNQTYDNLEVLVIDDFSTEITFESLIDFISKRLTKVKYKISQNEKNMGSNKTFEALTIQADGDYLAYCDQDDVWQENKIERLVEYIELEGLTTTCSDVNVIDHNGNLLADSITKVRKRHNLYPENPKEYLICENFVIGCTMLIDSKFAKSAVPFLNNMVHDHYLAIYSAVYGNIKTYNAPLVNYRIHGNNQTGVLSKVVDKKSYFEQKISIFYDRVNELAERFNENLDLTIAKKWANARVDNFNRLKGSFKRLYKLRKMNKAITFFELIALKNKIIFKCGLKLIKKGAM